MDKGALIPRTPLGFRRPCPAAPVRETISRAYRGIVYTHTRRVAGPPAPAPKSSSPQKHIPDIYIYIPLRGSPVLSLGLKYSSGIYVPGIPFQALPRPPRGPGHRVLTGTLGYAIL